MADGACFPEYGVVGVAFARFIGRMTDTQGDSS